MGSRGERPSRKGDNIMHPRLYRQHKVDLMGYLIKIKHKDGGRGQVSMDLRKMS